MTTVYKQFFWTIAADVTAQPEDIGCEKRTHLHQAAWDLHSIPSVLLACAGGGTAQDHPEISLTFPAETHNTAEQFTDHIQKALANHGYHAKPTLQEETRFYTLDESDVARVKAAASCTEDEKEMWRLIESAHSVTFDSPESIKLLDADSSSPFTAPAPAGAAFTEDAPAPAGPAFSFAEGAPAPAGTAFTAPAPASGSFTVNAETYAALKDARGDTIRTTTKRIYDAIQSLKDETRAGAIALKMAAGGLVTVGIAMYEAYAVLIGATVSVGVSMAGGSAVTFGAAALAAAGGPVGIAIAVALIIAAVVARFVVMKDAVNDLLFANDSKFKIVFNSEHIENGERAFREDEIPARVDLADGTVAAYPCGVYIYRKYQAGFLGAFGFFGSMFGIRFDAKRGSLTDGFSIGMECPNTALGGRNSIYCTTQSARAASGGASAGGYEEGIATTAHGKLTGRRANPWGNINYGVAFFESTA